MDPPQADADTFSVTATKRVGSGTTLDCSKMVVAVAVPGTQTIGTATARRASRERHLQHPESIPTSDVIGRRKGTTEPEEEKEPSLMATR